MLIEPVAGTPSLARLRAMAEKIEARQCAFEEEHDPRAVFAFVYHNITQDLADHIERNSEAFRHPEWVVELAVAFAGRYLDAMEVIDRMRHGLPPSTSTAVPRPWIDVDEAIRNRRSYVLEDLLFSMGAHISYDLPMVLIQVGVTLEHLPDYHQMNEVLAKNTDRIEDAVSERYQRTLGWLDWLVGNFDEFFTNYGIRTSRSLAWYNATRLLSPGRDAAIASIERSTSAFIASVRRPDQWWLRWGLRVARVLIPRRRRWPRKQEPSRRPIVPVGGRPLASNMGDHAPR